MALSERFPSWIRPLAYLGRNPISLAGAVLTTTSAITMIAYWVFEIGLGGGAQSYPYAGIVFFLILPGLFVVGLILMPVGGWWRFRQLRRRGALPAAYPAVDLGDPLFRRTLILVGTATLLNLMIFTVASYAGTQYMDSVQFCGATCHTVMQPEYTAYLNSPHSRVACVDCHIGPGASWFVRSKVSGVKQVFAVAFRDYPKPIPSPVEQLRPARATCEQCHWPQRFAGDSLLVLTHYQADEANTVTKTVLLMKVGGRNATGMAGIHGHHLDPGVRITYIATDDKRQVIPQVTYVAPDGAATVYQTTDQKATADELARGEHRLMDCMDCHNRPTHTFELPNTALDKALSQALVSADLPYIKKQALAALQASYADRNTATSEIAGALRAFYQKNYPAVVSTEAAKLEQAIRGVQSIYLRNVFPEMKVSWGTYVNNLGHTDSLGCFRCHDGSHTSADGRTIPNDCGTCHDLLAVDEQNPKILADLGMK